MVPQFPEYPDARDVSGGHGGGDRGAWRNRLHVHVKRCPGATGLMAGSLRALNRKQSKVVYVF